jgi:outer membrane protein TolC
VNSASVDSLLVKAQQKPQINANAQLLYAPFSNHFGYDDAITNGGNYSALAGATQPIFNGRALKNKYEEVDIQRHSLTNTSKISSHDLIRAITNQYLAVYFDYNDFLFNKTYLDLLSEERNVLKQLVEHGVYKQTDYLALLIETQTQEMLIKQLKALSDKDTRLLNQLCGINDTGEIKPNLPVINKSFAADPSMSPLFMQFKFDSLKIINGKRTIDVKYQPKLNWFADAGLLSSNLSNIYQHYGFSVGLNFNIPIYDGHQRKLEYQKLDLSENTRANYQVFFKSQYYQQIQQLNNDLEAAIELTADLKNQLSTSEELIKMAKAQLNIGNMLVIDYITALKNYMGIHRNLNQSQLKILQTTNELNFLYQQ